ncbi:MAG: hypothetical protein DSY87_09095 [Methylococcus sp.]|nr:MAG: hypothetical protein DSY87_09095 [Methylococcus sp.]
MFLVPDLGWAANDILATLDLVQAGLHPRQGSPRSKFSGCHPFLFKKVNNWLRIIHKWVYPSVCLVCGDIGHDDLDLYRNAGPDCLITASAAVAAAFDCPNQPLLESAANAA